MVVSNALCHSCCSRANRSFTLQEVTQQLLALLKDYLERRHASHDHKKGGLTFVATLRDHPGAAQEPDAEKAQRMRTLEVQVHLDMAMHGERLSQGYSGVFKWGNGAQRLLAELFRHSDDMKVRACSCGAWQAYHCVHAQGDSCCMMRMAHSKPAARARLFCYCAGRTTLASCEDFGVDTLRGWFCSHNCTHS